MPRGTVLLGSIIQPIEGTRVKLPDLVSDDDDGEKDLTFGMGFSALAWYRH